VGQASSASYRFVLPTNISRSNVKEIDLNVASRFADGSTGQIYMLNWGTGKWDILKAYSCPVAGVSVTAALRSSFNTYVSAAGEFRVLIRGVMPTSAGVTGNTFDTDYFKAGVIHLSVS
jgi:hypothetical protein